MNIKTARFGTIDVNEDSIIHMPFGMLGFPKSKRYLILGHKEDSPFYWFQSVDEEDLAFVITNPFLFKSDFEIDLGETLRKMSWNAEGDDSAFDLYVVVNIPKGDPGKMTANLIGPILVNRNVHHAVQMVVPESPYSHRYPLLAERES